MLTPQEIVDLFRIVKHLRDSGVSIIFISHKLKEVLEIADRVTVMRRGRVVGQALPSESDEHSLASMMVGRDVILQVEKSPAQPQDVVLKAENLTVLGEHKTPIVNRVNFEVRQGEILGIAGVQGNGQTELAEAITGLRPVDDGVFTIAGNVMPFKNPRHLVEHGMAHIPEDRHKHGLVLPYSIADNMVLCTYYREPFAQHGTRNDKMIFNNAEQLVKDYDVRTPSVHVTAATLSGGNQQKVIVARELSREVSIVVANQPTRGLDVGSIEYIHSTLVRLRDEGCGILLVSAELDEILALSDRIAVMYRGEIVAFVDAKDANREELGLLMAGSKKK